MILTNLFLYIRSIHIIIHTPAHFTSEKKKKSGGTEILHRLLCRYHFSIVLFHLLKFKCIKDRCLIKLPPSESSSDVCNLITTPGLSPRPHLNGSAARSQRLPIAPLQLHPATMPLLDGVAGFPHNSNASIVPPH